MKKSSKIVALLVTVVMITGMLPVTSFATLTWSTNQVVTNNFTGFEKNTGTVPDSNTFLSTNGYYLSNAGVGADYEPVMGVFGKAADDTSVKITRIIDSTATASISPSAKQAHNGDPEFTDYISMNWNWAFGDFEVERSLDAKFYINSSYSFDRVSSFAYNANGGNESSVLTLYPDGRVKFFGKTISKVYYFNTDAWYNFEIRIKVGRTTAEADAINAAKEEGAEDVAAVKSTAYLYVDGVLISEQEINNATDSSTTIGKPYSIYTASFTSKGVKYAFSNKANKETTYIDDMVFAKFKANSKGEIFKTYGDLSITSDMAYTDGIHLALKETVTAQDFIDSITKGANVMSVKLLDEKGAEIEDMSLEVHPGWFLNVQTDVLKIIKEGPTDAQDTYGYDSYNRKITDSLTYYNLNFEGNAPALPSGFSDLYGYWASNVEYVSNTALTQHDKVAFGLREDNACMVANKYAKSNSGAAEIKLRYKATGVDAEKYVLEFAALRKEIEGAFSQASLTIGGIGTILAINDNSGVTVRKDNGDFPEVMPKPNKTQNRWVKLAMEVDTTTKTINVYVNGKYVLTRNVTSTDSILNEFGILCNNTSVYNSTLGLVAMDDIKIYSGAYKPETLTVTESDENITSVYGDIFRLSGNMSIADFKAATGADAIYSYADNAFVAEITEGNVADGNVAVFYDDDSTIVKYYDIELLPAITGVTFDTNVDGKITAKASIETRSANHYLTDGAILVIAKKEENELVDYDICQIEDFSEVKLYELAATIDYAQGDSITAYFWKDTLVPFSLPVPFNAQ